MKQSIQKTPRAETVIFRLMNMAKGAARNELMRTRHASFAQS